MLAPLQQACLRAWFQDCVPLAPLLWRHEPAPDGRRAQFAELAGHVEFEVTHCPLNTACPGHCGQDQICQLWLVPVGILAALAVCQSLHWGGRW